MFQDVPSAAFGTTILTAVVASAIGGALSGVFLWWRQSAVQQAKNDARDEKHTAELQHFRTETEKMFGKMEHLMNGFGARLDATTEQQRKLWFTVFGPTETNGLHGGMRELVKDFAAMIARLNGVELTAKDLVQDVAQHNQRIEELRRGAGGTSRGS